MSEMDTMNTSFGRPAILVTKPTQTNPWTFLSTLKEFLTARLPITLILGTLVVVMLYWWMRNDSKGYRPLPGPWGIPFIGRVHDVDPTKPWFKQAEWCTQYNGYYKTTIMGETHLWIGTQRVAHDLLAKRAPIYSSRPEVPAVPGSDSQAQYLPLLARGEAWRRQRKFVQIMLTNAASAKFHGYIDVEAKRFLSELLKNPEGYYDLINQYTGRISARLNYGKPDSACHHVRNAEEFIPQISPAGSVTNLAPFLGYLPEFLNTSKRAVRERREREAELWHGLLKQARDDFEKGVVLPQNYARTYFERKAAECTTKSEPAGSAYGFEPDDREVACAIGMLCTVAIFTIGGPLNTFFLSMVLHPGWQEKARAEVDAVVGDRIIACAADSPNLPILRAVLKEAVRWRPTVPLGVPRLVEEDNEYEGHLVTKGTIAHVVEMAMSRDPEIYPNPEIFNPARWLEPEYPTYKAPLTAHPSLNGYHQFGSGWRVCPGVAQTELELLTVCAGILRAFKLERNVGEDGKAIEPDPWKMSSNVIGGPLEFGFNLKSRGKESEERVASLWFDAEASAGVER